MNTQITCDVCQDLLPLVLDGVASRDSQELVQAHLEHCESCRALAQPASLESAVPDDRRVLLTIRRRLSLVGLALLIGGALLGVCLSNSMGMFYNFLILPCVGALAYATLRNRWYLAWAGVFVLSYFWFFFTGLSDSASFTWRLFLYPLPMTVIYLLLTCTGTAIATLLHFAFRKEKSQ